MPGFLVEVDPEGAPFAFSEANGFYLLGPLKSPLAQPEQQWVYNADTEGEQSGGSREKNTEIGVKVRLVGASAKQFQERQLHLEQKIDKLRREGGVLRIHYPDGSWIDWEVRGVTGGDRLLDNGYIANWRTEDELTFVCAPFGEGEEELVGEYEFSGEAKRVLECEVADVRGSALALARAEIVSPEADMWDVSWGRESARYSDAATAKAIYAATALTPLGGAVSTTATIEGKAGVPIIQGTLTPNWTAQLSTEIKGVGHLTHAGIFEVVVWICLPATNTGEVGVGLEYGVPDGGDGLAKRTELDPVYFGADHPREGKVVKLSLGQVFLDPVGRGEHSWEGRPIFRSTVAGDKVQILDVAFRPLAEGNGRISVPLSFRQPAALLTRDEFNQSAGNLNGKGLAAAGSVVGPKTPGTLASVAPGEVGWANPSFAGAADAVYATATASFGGFEEFFTQYLRATNFGFAIPVGSTISGVVFAIRGKASMAPAIYDKEVLIVKGGVIQGTNHAAGLYGETDFTTFYGSNVDTWGVSLTHTDVNASNFGVALKVALFKLTAGTVTASIDAITATVYYTDPAGQTWSTTGDAVDITVDEGVHSARRTEVSDASVLDGRYAIAGTAVTSDVVAGIKAKHQALPYAGNGFVWGASLARYVDVNNWALLAAAGNVAAGAPEGYVEVGKRVAGTYSKLQRINIPDTGEYRSLWLQIDRRGRYFCWGALVEGGAPRLMMVGQDDDFKEGGVLDDGKNGFYDVRGGAEANTRYYDQFVAWVPPLEAVIFQGQAMELTHDACRREVLSASGRWTDLVPEGSYLKLAPAGLENRKNRLVFIASPNDPDTMGVGFPKKLKVAIYVRPRYRTVPQPA